MAVVVDRERILSGLNTCKVFLRLFHASVTNCVGCFGAGHADLLTLAEQNAIVFLTSCALGRGNDKIAEFTLNDVGISFGIGCGSNHEVVVVDGERLTRGGGVCKIFFVWYRKKITVKNA